MDSAEFGKETGYGQSTIRDIELGKRTTTDSFCERVCNCFDVSKDWMFDDTDLTGLDGKSDLIVEKVFTDYYEEDGKIYPRRSLIPALQAKRVREVYEGSGLLQREFCEKTGWTLSNLSDMLNGKRKLSYRYAERLEKSFHVGVDWLLYGDEDAKENPCNEEMVKFLKKHPEIRKKIQKVIDQEDKLSGGKS